MSVVLDKNECSYLDLNVIDPEMKLRLYKFAKDIVGLTLWPNDPDSVLCRREIDKMSLEELIDFSAKIGAVVKAFV